MSAAYFADHAIAIFVGPKEDEERERRSFLLFRDDYNFGTAELDPSPFQRRQRRHGVLESHVD